MKLLFILVVVFAATLDAIRFEVNLPNIQELPEQGEVDLSTICEKRKFCPEGVDIPVCGTDGVTYANPCAVVKLRCDEGQSELGIEHRGECGSEPVEGGRSSRPTGRHGFNGQIQRPNGEPIVGGPRQQPTGRPGFVGQRQRPNGEPIVGGPRQQPTGRPVFDGQRHRPIGGPSGQKRQPPIAGRPRFGGPRQRPTKPDFFDDVDIEKVCERSRICSTKVEIPICGTDNVTYNGICELLATKCETEDLELKVEYFGACGEKVVRRFPDFSDVDIEKVCERSRNCSTKVEKPICGTDNVTYNGICELLAIKCETEDLELKVEYFGACGDKVERRFPGPFHNRSKPDPEVKRAMCARRKCFNRDSSLDSKVICGSDNVTYENICDFKVEKCVDIFLTIAKRGECTEDQGNPEEYCVKCPFIHGGNRGHPRPSKGGVVGKEEREGFGERFEGPEEGGHFGNREEGGRPRGGKFGNRQEGDQHEGGKFGKRQEGGRQDGGKPEGGRPTSRISFSGRQDSGPAQQGGRPQQDIRPDGRPQPGGRPQQGGKPDGGRRFGERPEGGKPDGGIFGSDSERQGPGGRPKPHGGRKPNRHGKPAPKFPVCGTDGVTYSSACELKRTACILRDFDLDVESFGPCHTSEPTTAEAPFEP